MKRLTSIIISLAVFLCLFLAASGVFRYHAPIKDNTLSFSNRVEAMKELENQRVSLVGYMSTVLSDGGRIAYITSTPLSSKPFSEDNSRELYDTLAVQAVFSEELEYTPGAVRAEGVLSFGSFSDSSGNSYTYKLTDATVTPLSGQELEGRLESWQQLIQSDILTDTQELYSCLSFLCNWPSYSLTTEKSESFMTPERALFLLNSESLGFAPVLEPEFCDSLLERVSASELKQLSFLEKELPEIRLLCQRLLEALKNGEYTLDGTTGKYTLNESEDFEGELRRLYKSYNNFLRDYKI